MSAGPPLHVEVVETLSAFRRLEADWTRLFEATPTKLPFATFDWAAAWWLHFSRRVGLALRDELAVRVVKTPAGEVKAIAPMMRTFRPGLGPVATRELHFFGADHNLTELRSVVCAPGDAAAAYAALAEHFRETSGQQDWVYWSHVPDALAPAVEVLRTVEWETEVPNYVLPLAGDWETFKAGLKRNVRESLRKCYNSPKRDGLEFTFHALSKVEDLPAAVEHLVRLHGLRSTLEDTVKHPNVFRTETARRFFHDVVRRLAAKGQVRAFQLRLGDRVIATRFGFVFGDVMYLYYSGYEPELGKYSVMTTTVAEALKWAMANGVASVNLSIGNDVSKTRWGPQEFLYRTGLVISPSLRSRAALALFDKANELAQHPRLRRHLKR